MDKNSYHSTQNLNKRTALITGGGTGIGAGIALAYAQSGISTVICGRRQEPLNKIVQKINGNGGKGLAVQADVSKSMDVDRLVEKTIDAFGKIDILVNNAGISGGGEIHLHSINDWDHIMSVNLRGPFLMSRAVLPHMRKQKRGHILNISSESGIAYYKGNGAYGVSKHALNALSEYIQRENQDFGIRVDTICPGMVITEMSRNTSGLDHNKCLYPEDIADLALWLITRRQNIKIGNPLLIQTMENPWE